MKKIILLCFLVLAISCGDTNKVDTVVSVQNPLDVKTKMTELKLPGKPFTEGEQVLKTEIAFTPPPALHGHPYIAAGVSWISADLMYERLAEYDPYDGGKYDPRLLDSFKINGSVVTLKLKPNLKWSNDEEINADDIIVNLMLSDAALMMGRAKSIRKVDNLTVDVEYPGPVTDILKNRLLTLQIAFNKGNYAKFADVRKKVFDIGRTLNADGLGYTYTDEGRQMNTDLLAEKNLYHPNIVGETACSGAFIVQSATTSELIFAKNENYYSKDTVYIDKVIGMRQASVEGSTIAIAEGYMDIEGIGMSLEMSVATVQNKQATMRQYAVSEYASGGMFFNTSQYPTDNRDFRRAISYLLDVTTLAPLLEAGFAAPDLYQIGLPIVVRDKFLNSSDLSQLEKFEYNQDKAKEILEGIGWKKVGQKWQDPNGQNPEIVVTAISEWAGFNVGGEATATTLSEFGLNTVYRPKDYGTYYDFIRAEKPHMSMQFWANATSQSPYNGYNNDYLFQYMGIEAPESGKKREIIDEVTGNIFKFGENFDKIFLAENEDDMRPLVKEFATFFNNQVYVKTMFEKQKLLRIHNPKLSLPEGKAGELVSGFYYEWPLPSVIVRMIKYGELYFVE